MGLRSAVAAYRRSNYDYIEWDIAQRIGRNSYPIVGGWGSAFGKVCNAVACPFKVGWALLGGSAGKLSEVELTEIPPDIAASQYGSDIRTLRTTMRERADARVLKWTKFFQFKIGESYRQEAVEAHHDLKLKRGLIMPEDVASGELGAIPPPVFSGNGRSAGQAVPGS